MSKALYKSEYNYSKIQENRAVKAIFEQGGDMIDTWMNIPHGDLGNRISYVVNRYSYLRGMFTVEMDTLFVVVDLGYRRNLEGIDSLIKAFLFPFSNDILKTLFGLLVI
ncbi:hypothetical protein [Lysinibacillus sp. NPDC092081]|uniref:hypothetical protein n=1 Tax=Lysinibacillus sp. NPDC092081 TaxID=3364131 RepID=UPI00383083AC